VPHGSLTEYELLKDVPQAVLETGIRIIQEKF
jgi:hypothetical protein